MTALFLRSSGFACRRAKFSSILGLSSMPRTPTVGTSLFVTRRFRGPGPSALTDAGCRPHAGRLCNVDDETTRAAWGLSGLPAPTHNGELRPPGGRWMDQAGVPAVAARAGDLRGSSPWDVGSSLPSPGMG